MPDIIQLLEADHKEVKGLLKKLTADKEPDDCDALFEKLYTSVTVHAQFEEDEVYPLLKKGETKDLVLEAYEEHAQVKTLLEALHESDDADETCTAKLNVLSEDLTHHITEEEGELFPLLRKAVSAEVLTRLGQSYQEVKDQQAAGADRSSDDRDKGDYQDEDTHTDQHEDADAQAESTTAGKSAAKTAVKASAKAKAGADHDEDTDHDEDAHAGAGSKTAVKTAVKTSAKTNKAARSR
jgi:hemerythrin superfamily protein